MLAFFGAPVAHEDDPERAILAALDMLAAIEEFARQLKATQRHRLPDPGRHQHRAGHGRQRRLRPALRVHGPRRRGERRRADADRGAARDGPHHRDDAPPRPATRSTSRTSAASRSRARPSRSTPSGSSGARPRRRGGAASSGRPRQPDGRAGRAAAAAAGAARASSAPARPGRVRRRRAGHRQEPAARRAAGAPCTGAAERPAPPHAGSRAAASPTAATCRTTC